MFWLADSFQATVEDPHQQVVVTSKVCSWKTSCSGTFTLDRKRFLTRFYQSGCVLSIWAMPDPSSGYFVMTKSVRRHKIVKGGKLQMSDSSLIYVVIAEGSTNALPVSTSIPAHCCIPVPLLLYYCDVERDCRQADGDEPVGDWVTSHDSVLDILVSKKSNAMLVFILFSTEENLVSFLCRFARRLPPHFTESKDVPSVPVHFVC